MCGDTSVCCGCNWGCGKAAGHSVSLCHFLNLNCRQNLKTQQILWRIVLAYHIDEAIIQHLSQYNHQLLQPPFNSTHPYQITFLLD